MHYSEDSHSKSKSHSHSSHHNDPIIINHHSPNNSDQFHQVPLIDLSDDDMDSPINSTQYLAVKQQLSSQRVSKSDIEFLESRLHELAELTFDIAIMRILQHKIEQAHNGEIKNKGIHKTEAPPYAFYDEEEMALPTTKKFKAQLATMNAKNYTDNRIEWLDFTQLRDDDSVDYRNDDGRFVVAKVMEIDGVELVLYTSDGQTVMINFLNQYPFQRLFKAGSVTARIPKKIRRKSVEIGSEIRLLCDTDFIMDSKWTKMECKVVGRDIDEREEDEANGAVKQIQIEFVNGSNGRTNGLGMAGTEKHRMWVHLDNTRKIEEGEDENDRNIDDDDEHDNTMTVTPNQCCVIL